MTKSFVEHNINIFWKDLSFMILVGIDVAKNKQDWFIQTAEGKVLCKAFSFANNYESFEELYLRILSCDDVEVKVGLESTGHYSYNLLGFLLSKELPTFVFNPLQTNQFRKSLSLRKTKTDKVDGSVNSFCIKEDKISDRMNKASQISLNSFF